MKIDSGKKAPRIKGVKRLWMLLGGIWFSDVYITNKGDLTFGDMLPVPSSFFHRRKIYEILYKESLKRSKHSQK